MVASHLFFLSILLMFSFSRSCDNNVTYSKNHHGWIGPVGQQKIVVDASGTGDFLSIQEAVDSIPENNTKRYIIQINAGSYMYFTLNIDIFLLLHMFMPVHFFEYPSYKLLQEVF
jgi:Pectinesterase